METNDPLNATVVGRMDITPVLAILRVRHENGEASLDFEPGQFATLGLPAEPDPASTPAPAPASGVNPPPVRRRKGPRMVRRAYSIASAPQDGSGLEFFVAKVDGGRLTPHLWDVGEGGRVFMDQRIRGEFTLADVPEQADVLMIATGTGVAPFVSMVRAYRGRGRWRRCALVHTTRQAADLAYHDAMENVAQNDPTFRYLPMLTREPSDSTWPGLRGRPQALFEAPDLADRLGFEFSPSSCHVMLCGNPAMIDEVSQAIGVKGFTREGGNLHFERYW